MLHGFFHSVSLRVESDRKMLGRYARASYDCSFKRLRRIVPFALDTVTLDRVHKHLSKCLDYHHAYIDGKTAVDVVTEVKTNKSHRT